jgi:hypothetical protein
LTTILLDIGVRDEFRPLRVAPLRRLSHQEWTLAPILQLR